jgi:hypothetical protein
MIRQGWLVRYSGSSAEAKSLKMGFKGLFDYHCNEIAVQPDSRENLLKGNHQA